MNTEEIQREGIDNFLFGNVKDELEALSIGLKHDWKTKAEEPPSIVHGWSDEEIHKFMKEFGLE